MDVSSPKSTDVTGQGWTLPRGWHFRGYLHWLHTPVATLLTTLADLGI